jgi:hypothetical protein
VFGALGGVVAIVLGGIGMSRTKRSGQKGRGWAITGLVTGILSIVLAAVVMFAAFSIFQDLDGFEAFADFEECLEQTGDEQACQREFEDRIQRRIFGDQ